MSTEPATRAASPGFRPPRQARSQETLERFLEAGEALLGERGYDGMRLRDVAEASGATVGAFYLRFKDKESFFYALLDRFIARARARAEAEMAPEIWRDLSALEVISQLLEAVVQLFREHRSLLRAFLHRRVMEPDKADPLREFGIEIAGSLAAILAEKRDEIAHPDLEVAVGFTLQIVFSSLVHAVLDDPGPVPLSNDRLAPELTQLLARYLRVGGVEG